MKTLNDIGILIQFYTRLPLRVNLTFQKERYAKSVYLLPLVSLLLGLILALFNFAFKWTGINNMVNGSLLLAVSIYLTGGLHLDGLADTFDGFLSYRKKDEILEIMKDPRIGVNGVIGLLVVLIIKFSIYSTIGIVPIVLSIVSARLNLIYQSYKLDYAREKGMGSALFEYVDKKTFIKGLVLTLGISAWFYAFIPVILLNLAIAHLINLWAKKVIDGGTGDTLGMTVELSEVTFLILTLLIYS